MKLKHTLTALVASLSLASTAHAIVITPESNGTALANAIVGTGVTISNVSYVGAAAASGTFTDGLSSGIGIDSGLILSTGTAAGASGPNNNVPDSSGTAGDESTDNGLPGFTPLDALAGVATYDATVLSFDFEFDGGLGGDLFFNMVFGSEEYNEYVFSGVNDTFAFFLDGTNIALLPDSTPISIDTVNLSANTSLFNDNNDGSSNIEFDGFTNVLQISALGLSAGAHTMQFAIADGGDSILDSWVMIQGSSFSNEPTNVPEPGTLALLGLGMAGLLIRRKQEKN